MSISTKELRLGNFVQTEDRSPNKVISINKRSVRLLTSFGDEIEVEADALDPIVISEPWFDAFDFKLAEPSPERANHFDPFHWEEIRFFIHTVRPEDWYPYEIHFQVIRSKRHPQDNDQSTKNQFAIETIEQGDGIPSVTQTYSSTKFVHNLQNAFYQAIGEDLILKYPKWVK